MDHLEPVETAGVDRKVPELDRNRVAAGSLEEGEAPHPGLVEDPISGELRARVSEPDQPTARPLSAQEAPTSKPGTESEMLEEVSEPGRPDRRNQEILHRVSCLFDLASEKRSSQDRVHLTDSVLASTVMENSSVMGPVEFCSLAERSRRGQTVTMEEQGAKV